MITDLPSPNYGHRPAGSRISLIVLHGTAGSYLGDVAWCRDPKSGVSYHYVIGRAGEIARLVDERGRAWHAGVSSWRGRANCNDYSIGVAFSNRGPGSGEAYTDEQYAAGARLVAGIMERHGLHLDSIVTHAEVSPGRKTDPWSHFDLRAFLVAVALERWPDPPTPPAVRAA